jgi:predicted anti-sigma-YlaC factor YlaD
MAATELTCRELVEIVSDYLEDRLSPIDRQRFEEHLTVCEGCANYVEQMRDTIRLAGRLTENSIPVPARERLLQAFRDWKSA